VQQIHATTPKQATLQNAAIQMDKRESKYRLVKNDFLSPVECELLSQFAGQNCVIGDGYGGHAHPHTPTETFSGYSFNGKSGDTSLPQYHLALEVMMRARNLLRWHFKLPMLWLEYGHLVKREVHGQQRPDEEFSHPWHYDDATDKFRSHTAILYINDGFEGGHTCFKEADFGPYREITPKAGTLVAFSVAQNSHAVTKLLSGERYVLNMWFSTHWRKFRQHRRIFRPL
jgi:hypothetical protein